MINRYTRPAMGAIWELQNKFSIWKEIEVLACEAQAELGQAGITKCSPHDLRRTFATAMLDNGEDLITVKDAMGHASVTTTQQYDRRGEQRLQDARDRLNLI